MKTIEEKAKAYNEAIRKAKIILGCCNSASIITKHTIYDIFPELAESEDERIKKALITLIQSCDKGCYTTISPSRIKEYTAWLEKQGEQKNKMNSYKITFEDVLALECSMKTAKITKGGDELYKILVPLYNKIHNAYLDELQGEQKSADKVEPKFKVGNWIIFNGLTLYINEVVEGYYRTISIGGIPNSYDWDIDNVARLWTIQDAKAGDVLEFGDHGRLVVGIVSFISKMTGRVDVYCLLEANNFKVGNYYALDTINPHPATKEQRDTLFAKMKEAGYEWDAEKKELKVDYPDNLPKDNWELVHEFVEKFGRIPEDEDELNALVEYILKRHNSAWSEEDEKMLQGIWDEILANKHDAKECEWKTYDKFLDWLKSLKPQSHWKPSDEQIQALDNARHSNSFNVRILDTLFHDLKKLREE